MAPGKRRPVTVQYRRLDVGQPVFGSATLQQALAACMQKPAEDGSVGENPVARQYPDAAFGTMLLNDFHSEERYYFGELVRFQPGEQLPLLKLVELESGAKAYNLTQAKAPDGHEPIKGILYFMVIGNHFLVAENDLTTARAERYLTWLLSERTTMMARGSHVILIPGTDSASLARLGEVSEVVFRPQPIRPLEVQGDLVEQDRTVTATGTRMQEVEKSNTFEVLRAAGFDETDIHRLANESTSLEVTVQVRFKKERRAAALSSDDTNRLLRNLPEDEIVLKGPAGRQREGRIERLTYKANVIVQGSLLDPTDVARALYEGYQYFTTNEYIDG